MHENDSQVYELCCYNAVSENRLELRMAFSNSIKGQLLSLSRAVAIAIEGEQGANLGDEKLRLGSALSVGRGRSRVRDTCGKSHLDCTRIMSQTSMTSANLPRYRQFHATYLHKLSYFLCFGDILGYPLIVDVRYG